MSQTALKSLEITEFSGATRVVLGVGQAHGGFFWDRPIYDVATGPQMLSCDAVGVTPRHAGSGPIAGGLGGALSPPAGFGAEPRELSVF